MKLLACLLAAFAYADSDGDIHPAYEKHPIKDVVKRLDKLQSVGEECRGKLIDVNAEKQKTRMQVFHKLFTMDRVARKFYNKMNGDGVDFDLQAWADVDKSEFDRAIATDDPCSCLYLVGRGYHNFFTRGYGHQGNNCF